MYDVIIVGGSYAGLAAALQIARARRRVLVLDAGERRNRFASHAHGFLGQDGQPPGLIAAKGRAEVLAYPTVTWRDAVVTDVRAIDGGFTVRAGGDEHQAKRIILATGVVDALPDVPGIAERWGTTVFHCPYCHGYELGRGRLGVLATSALSMHAAALVSEWSAEGATTFFINDAFEPDAAQREELRERGIAVEHTRVVCAEGEAPHVALRLADGRVHMLDGLFLLSRMDIKSSFAEQLGCEIETGPLGTYYKTDAMKETTVPGVFACGDAGVAMGAISFAVADGVRAGVSAHQSLVFRRTH
jgi:thioredoxin reductase